MTGVNDQDSFNAASFVEHVEKPVTRYIVRSKDESIPLEKSKKEQIAQNCNNLAENDNIPASESEDKSQDET